MQLRSDWDLVMAEAEKLGLADELNEQSWRFDTLFRAVQLTRTRIPNMTDPFVKILQQLPKAKIKDAVFNANWILKRYWALEAERKRK